MIVPGCCSVTVTFCSFATGALFSLKSFFKGTVVGYVLIKKKKHVGRVRFMRMHTSNRALSFHYDDSFRLHIPIITNKDSWFMNEDNSMHQMDKLGHLYYLDATRNHSALMLSRNEDRVHVVFSVKGK